MDREILPLLGSDDDAQRLLLAHVDRMWKAEEVNATRLASKATMVSAGITGTLGFKLFVAGSAVPAILAAPIIDRCVILTFGSLSGVFLLFSIWSVVDIKIQWRWLRPWFRDLWQWVPFTQPIRTRIDLNAKPASACETMGPEEDERAEIQKMTEPELVRYLTQKVDVAASELRSRNSNRKWRVESSERRFLCGLVLLLFTAGWYVSVVFRNERGRIHGQALNAQSENTRR